MTLWNKKKKHELWSTIVNIVISNLIIIKIVMMTLRETSMKRDIKWFYFGLSDSPFVCHASEMTLLFVHLAQWSSVTHLVNISWPSFYQNMLHSNIYIIDNKVRFQFNIDVSGICGSKYTHWHKVKVQTGFDTLRNYRSTDESSSPFQLVQ